MLEKSWSEWLVEKTHAGARAESKSKSKSRIKSKSRSRNKGSVTHQGFSSEPESKANESGDRTLKPDPIFKPKGNQFMLQLANIQTYILADHVSGNKGIGSELAIV